MLTRNHFVRKNQKGFTLIELLITISLITIVSTIFLTLFKSSLANYLNLQKDGSSFTVLASQSARVANVLRGTTGIISADTNDLVVYAYFYPFDTYVSKLHYYLQTNNGIKQLRADLTPMTANPPIGTPITAQMKSFVIIDNFYQPVGGNLFTYLGASGSTLTLPITDLQTIKGMQVNLASTTAVGDQNQAINLQVSLRNRKTNL